MKFAKSMRYGGELINAMECDYDSYLNLGVVCPECHESLYLRAGGERVSPKGKPYKIGAHWCHRKGTPEQIAGCELRVNGYTEQDRARIAAQARGQRLKLLQRWFWTAIEKEWGELPLFFDRDRSPVPKSYMGKTGDRLRDVMKSEYVKWIAYASEKHKKGEYSVSIDLFFGAQISPYRYEGSDLMHWKILEEVIDFVCAIGQQRAFNELVKMAFYIMPSKKEQRAFYEEYKDEMDDAEYKSKKQINHVSYHMIDFLMTVNWQTMFESALLSPEIAS